MAPSTNDRSVGILAVSWGLVEDEAACAVRRKQRDLLRSCSFLSCGGSVII